MARQPLPHRFPEFEALVGRVQADLRAILRSNATVVPVLGSGTTSLEIALRGLGRRRVLSLVAGAFAERSATIATSLGLEVERLQLPPGWAFTPDALDRALAAGSFDVVTVTHGETSTGAVNDVVALAQVVAAHPGVALIVDAVSTFGGMDLALDDLGPEVALVGVTGKCLACPPGMSILAISDGAAERAATAEANGHALRLETLVKSARRGRTPHTPSVPLFFALEAQLPRILAEGMAARGARHEAMAVRVRAWAEEHFAILAREEARGPTVTAIENTRGLDTAALLAAVERRGYRLAAGYGELKGATFRVGHLGDVTVAETEAMLGALDEAVAEVA